MANRGTYCTRAMTDDRVLDKVFKEPARGISSRHAGERQWRRREGGGTIPHLPGVGAGMRLVIVGAALSNPDVNTCRNPLAQEDMEEFSDAVRSADAVIDLAAICNPSEYKFNPINLIRTNFLEPVRIVDVCAEQRKGLIHLSTRDVYGGSAGDEAVSSLRWRLRGMCVRRRPASTGTALPVRSANAFPSNRRPAGIAPQRS